MSSIDKLHDSLFDEVIAVSFYKGTECISQLVDSQEAEQWDDKGFPADLLGYLCDIKKQTVEDYQKKIAKGNLSNPANLVIAADDFNLRALGFPVPTVGTRNSSSANCVESIVFFITSDINKIPFHLLCDVTLDRFLEPVEFFGGEELPDSAPMMTLDHIFRSIDTSGSGNLTHKNFCENAGTVFPQMRRRDLESAFQEILDVTGCNQPGDESSNPAVIDWLTFRKFIYGMSNTENKGLKKCTKVLKDLCQNCVEFSGYPGNLSLERVSPLISKLKDCEKVMGVMDKGLVIATEGVSMKGQRHWENSALKHRLRISTYRRILCTVLEEENEKLTATLKLSKSTEEDMARLRAEKLDIEEKYMELADASEILSEENHSLKKEIDVVKTTYSHQVIALDEQILKKKKDIQELRDQTVDMSGQMNIQKKAFQNEIATLEAKLKASVDLCSELEDRLAQAEGNGKNSHEDEMKALEEKFNKDMQVRDEKFREELKLERFQIASEWEDENRKLNEQLRSMQEKILKHKEELVKERSNVLEDWKDERDSMIEKIKSLEKTLDVGCFNSDGQEKLIEELRRQVEQSKLRKEHLAREERLHFETNIKQLKNSKELLKRTIDGMSNDLKKLQSDKDSQKESLKRTISSLSDDIKRLKAELSESQSQIETYEKQLREQCSLLKAGTEGDDSSKHDGALQSPGNHDIRSDSNGSEGVARNVNALSTEQVSSQTNEIKGLKAKLVKVEASFQKVVQDNKFHLASTEEKVRLEKQVKKLTSSTSLLEKRLSKANNEILKQKGTIQQLTNSLREKGASNLSWTRRQTKSDSNIFGDSSELSVGKLEKQHKQKTFEIARLQRKINSEEGRLKIGMQRLEEIKTKRRDIKDRRSAERKGLRKDRSQLEFDDMMEKLIDRVQDQKTEIENLRRKLRKSNMAGDRSETDKKRIQMLNSDLKKSRTKISTLEIELIKAKTNSIRRPTSNRETATSKRIQFLEMENKALQDQLQKMVLDVMQENRDLTDVDIAKWQVAVEKLRVEETSGLIAGGSLESGLENALQLLRSFYEECGPKKSHETFTSILNFIHEKHNELHWVKQEEDEKENSGDMIIG